LRYSGVQDFTLAYSADISLGANYSIDIEMGTCGGNYSGTIVAWIDFNADGDFDDLDEQLGTYDGMPTVHRLSILQFLPALLLAQLL